MEFFFLTNNCVKHNNIIWFYEINIRTHVTGLGNTHILGVIIFLKCKC